MIFLDGGKGCLQEMFGAVLLFCTEKKKQNDKIIIRNMSDKHGRGECVVSRSILYNALGVIYESMFFL